MKQELIRSLTDTFEGHAQQTESGVEYWLARDIQHLLGYGEWRNFNNSAISKAKTACEISGHLVTDHFVGVNKMVDAALAPPLLPSLQILVKPREQRRICDFRLLRGEAVAAAANRSELRFAARRQEAIHYPDGLLVRHILVLRPVDT